MTFHDRILNIRIFVVALNVGLFVLEVLSHSAPWVVALGAGTLTMALLMTWFWSRVDK